MIEETRKKDEDGVLSATVMDHYGGIPDKTLNGGKS